MIPGKFIAFQERSLGRRLSLLELAAVQAARASCMTGKRDTVKAMRAAMREIYLTTSPCGV